MDSIVSYDEMETVTDPSHINIAGVTGTEVSEALFKKMDEETRALIIFEEWALDYPDDDPTAKSRIMLLGSVEDYSEKAYKVEGAFWFDLESAVGRGADEISGSMHSFLTKLNNEELDDEGVDWIPKSAVKSMMATA